jgi:hypothetical protein
VSQNPSLVAPAKSLIGVFLEFCCADRRASALGLCMAAATLLSAVNDARADDIGESISLQLSTNATNTYAFRGFVLKDKGLISQYDSDLKVALVDTESLRFMVLGGFWMSLHPGDQATTGKGPAAWYESRFSGGLGVSARGVDAYARLVAYDSPNNSFSDIYEINLEGRFRDDTIWAGDNEDTIFRGIFPHIILAQELKGARDNHEYGRYIELGVAPRVRVLYSSLLGVDFSLPVTMGLNFGGYYQFPTSTGRYEDHALGFASFGAVLDLNLRMMPERLGLYHLKGYFTLLLPTAQADVPGSLANTVEPIGGVEGVLNF